MSAVLRAGPTAYYVPRPASLCADIARPADAGAVRTLLGRAQLGYLNRADHPRALPRHPRARGSDDLAPDAFFVFALAVLALPATRFALLLLRAPLARRRLRPVEVRNLDLPLAEPADAPAWTRLRLQTLVLMSAAVDRRCRPRRGAGTRGPRSSSRSPPSCCSRVVAGGRARAHPAGHAGRRCPTPTTCWRSATQVRALRPEVAVYFSGSASSIYQLNMWLPVLEQLDRRPVVILRERANLPGSARRPCRWSASPGRST